MIDGSRIFEDVVSKGVFIDWKEHLQKLHLADHLVYLIEGKFTNEEFGKKSFASNIPFLIIEKFTNLFLKQCAIDDESIQKIQNLIAKNHLDEKLTKDLIFLKAKALDDIPYATHKQKEIINEHLYWMINLINFIKHNTFAPEMDHNHCFVGKNLPNISNDNPEQKIQIEQKHELVHLLGKSAIELYRSFEYADFLSIYTDLFHNSLELQLSLLKVHLQQQLISMDTDPLTGLGNYFRLRFDLDNMSDKYYIFVLNINEFSKINIMFGHTIGDKLLKELSLGLKKFDQVEQVYRIYGDDFAVILRCLNPFEYASYLMKELEENPYCIDDGANISISLYGSFGKINEDVLSKNEYGLILAKDKKEKLINSDLLDTFYIQQYSDNMELARQLRISFIENNIEPYFQPILNIKANKIEKYEALMRIKHKNGSVSIPGDFLEVLKNMYIYPEFTKTIIKKTFEYFNELEYEFSINLSFKDIIHQDTKDFIITVLNLYPKSAKRCTFELLEYEAVDNNYDVKYFLKTIKRFGVKIALDDFGAGYSNYMGVFNFGIDYIKIDGTIIQNLLIDNRASAILESIMVIAKKLNVGVIAEFVSSKELFDKLKEFDVDYAQGYFIGKPSKDLVNER